MTNQEAIKEIENMRKFNYTLAPMEVFDKAVNALTALDEISSEISKLLDSLDANSAWYRLAIKDCLKVIDKYTKGEQE